MTFETTFEYGDARASNRLIQGDNDQTLSVMANELTGAVRCVYIDPPYSNSERYTHYDDKLSGDAWLSRLEATLQLLQPCLRQDGSIWISIDDQQVHYLKVAADRIFGRQSFLSTIVWEHRKSRENRRAFSNNHEYLLVYAADAGVFKRTRNGLAPTEELLSRYRNPDDDPRGPWQSVSANVQGGHGTASQFYELRAPSGRVHIPPSGRCWAYSEERMIGAIERGEVYFGKNGEGAPRLKRFLDESSLALTPETLWSADDVGTTSDAKKHLLSLLPREAVFDTPKPESLIRRVLAIASDPGDLVLDAYLGSGTTAAVAHKMGRSWIGIESGDHALTHAASRLKLVVDGHDPGGVTSDVSWAGGGGFRYERLSGDSSSALPASAAA